MTRKEADLVDGRHRLDFAAAHYAAAPCGRRLGLNGDGLGSKGLHFAAAHNAAALCRLYLRGDNLRGGSLDLAPSHYAAAPCGRRLGLRNSGLRRQSLDLAAAPLAATRRERVRGAGNREWGGVDSEEDCARVSWVRRTPARRGTHE
jgi:hypothetical protein